LHELSRVGAFFIQNGGERKSDVRVEIPPPEFAVRQEFC
jgi:hypothetical protein